MGNSSSNPSSSFSSNPSSSLCSNPSSGLSSNPSSALCSNPSSGLSSNPSSGLSSNPSSALCSNPSSGFSSNPSSSLCSQNPSAIKKNRTYAFERGDVIRRRLNSDDANRQISNSNPFSSLFSNPSSGLSSNPSSSLCSNPSSGFSSNPSSGLSSNPSSDLEPIGNSDSGSSNPSSSSGSGGGIGFHYGIYIGNGWVIHLDSDGLHMCTLKEFSVDYKLEVSKERIRNSKPPEEIATTAEYLLKNPQEFGDYCVVTNNCEHFARYCATGEKASIQVQIAAVVGGTVAVVGAVGLISLGIALFGNNKKK